MKLNRAFGRRSRRKTAPREMKLIEKVARFTACEMVQGDYLEFGVYKGHSFVGAYQAMQAAFESRIADAGKDNSTEDQAQKRQSIIDQMRFFAFDSFEGLPELEGIDKDTDDFRPGQYAFGEAAFRRRVMEKGVDPQRLVTIPGWFHETCTDETRTQHAIEKASVVWIDGDLYASAVSALQFITPLLQDGTVIIFDDWFAFRGNPQRGEQRAFHEWLPTVPNYTATEYQKEGVWRNSFIMNRLD